MRIALCHAVNVRTEHFVIISQETAVKDVRKIGRATNVTVCSVCLLLIHVYEGLLCRSLIEIS